MEKDDQASWTESYSRLRPTYTEYCRKLKELIETIIYSADVDVVQIDGRVKDVDSFAEKLTRKAGKYTDPLKEVTDLVGIRVITYYMEDVNEVADLIRNEFHVLEEHSVDKAAELADDQFGYSSFHLIFELGDSRKSLPEWRAFENYRAEIQIRTALQHAWAAVNHKIEYKKAHEVPRELRRKLFRLSALFELADEEFSNIKQEGLELSRMYTRVVGGGDYDVEINADSIAAWISVDPLVQDLLMRAKDAGYPRIDEGGSSQAAFDRTRLTEALDAYSIGKLSSLVDTLRDADEHIAPALRALSNEGIENNGFTSPEDLILQLLLVLQKADGGEWSDLYTSHLEEFENAKRLLPES
ncbi:GTP pyrophosphokinase [Streptomyces azureus]|uniref:Region found in RelA / SpoT s family protein n=1 Tax=Streptomyces azureus TaxID=146537 RepID=A0A0K8Q0G3_STRAJ|nr:hypothetical protein [Streptomyces azureus]GAP53239.1 region found in RelA / SpoT s family protein [Streptomyces azureus]